MPLDEAIECQEDGRAAVVDGFSSSVWVFFRDLLGYEWDINSILLEYSLDMNGI